MQPASFEKRRHPRHAHSDHIEFCTSDNVRQTLLGVSIDVSDTGMCFYTFDPLPEGQDILIKRASNLPGQKGNVRWINKYYGNYYRVGLQFCN